MIPTISRRFFLYQSLTSSLLLLGATRDSIAQEVWVSAPVNQDASVFPFIWLTLDACSGGFDLRSAEFLVKNKIRASVFVGGAWIWQNPKGVSFLKEHQEYFKIENHGHQHLANGFTALGPYGLPATKSVAGLEREVLENAKTINKVFNIEPSWFRGAGALYTKDALSWHQRKGIRVAGFTHALDEGGKIESNKLAFNMRRLENGKVGLVHINKPQGPLYRALLENVSFLKNNRFDWRL